jgi:aspartate kinase
VFVDMIVQNVSLEGNTDLSFTVPRESADRAAAAVEPLARGRIAVEPALAKLAVAGVGMRTHTGVATAMFGALAERSINIKLINTSEVRINVGTDIASGKIALECLREVFAVNGD